MPLLLPRGLLLASAAIALLALIARARVYWPFTVDDTFITLRYAKHLAHGFGPAWNPHGAPVEGYTTALWMAVLTVPHALGFDALTFAKVAGVVCAFATVAAAAALAYELARGLDARARRLAAGLAFALGAAYWPIALHAISGMETTLAALLLTTFALVSIRFVRAPTSPRARSLCLLALLSTLTRPEAGLACAATLGCALALLRKPERTILWHALGLFLLLPGAVYYALRYAHFGMPLPLSFYVKAKGQPLLAGLADVKQFFAPLTWERPALGLLALWGARGGRALVPALAGLGAFALFFLVPAHVMSFEGRYLFPIFPAFSALVGAGFARLAEPALAELAPLAESGGRWVEPVLALAGLAVCASIGLPAHEPEARARWLAYGAGLSRAHVALAKELRRTRLAVVDPTIALLDVGAVAYYSDWFTIDTYGLNDRRVALSRRTDVPYVFSHRPELLVVVSAEPERFVEVFEWERPLYATARSNGYEELCSYRFLDDYHLLVLARAGSPLRQALSCPRL